MMSRDLRSPTFKCSIRERQTPARRQTALYALRVVIKKRKEVMPKKRRSGHGLGSFKKRIRVSSRLKGPGGVDETLNMLKSAASKGSLGGGTKQSSSRRYGGSGTAVVGRGRFETLRDKRARAGAASAKLRAQGIKRIDNSQRRPPVYGVSFPAGAGGSVIGMQQAGVVPIVMADHDPKMISTLRKNWPNARLLDGSLKLGVDEDKIEADVKLAAKVLFEELVDGIKDHEERLRKDGKDVNVFPRRRVRIQVSPPCVKESKVNWSTHDAAFTRQNIIWFMKLVDGLRERVNQMRDDDKLPMEIEGGYLEMVDGGETARWMETEAALPHGELSWTTFLRLTAHETGVATKRPRVFLFFGRDKTEKGIKLGKLYADSVKDHCGPLLYPGEVNFDMDERSFIQSSSRLRTRAPAYEKVLTWTRSTHKISESTELDLDDDKTRAVTIEELRVFHGIPPDFEFGVETKGDTVLQMVQMVVPPHALCLERGFFGEGERPPYGSIWEPILMPETVMSDTNAKLCMANHCWEVGTKCADGMYRCSDHKRAVENYWPEHGDHIAQRVDGKVVCKGRKCNMCGSRDTAEDRHKRAMKDCAEVRRRLMNLSHHCDVDQCDRAMCHACIFKMYVNAKDLTHKDNFWRCPWCLLDYQKDDTRSPRKRRIKR